MSAPVGVWRFGEFTFDPQCGELRRGTDEIRLRPQASALLIVLAENSGAVVSRSQLKTALWPDTTVDFDDGLNFCVRQLRLALGDDPSAPRYIETLPRRGYRLIPSATFAREPAIASPAVTPRRIGRRLTATMAAWMLLVLVLAGAVALWANRERNSAASVPVLVVLPFDADSGDALVGRYQTRLRARLFADAAGNISGLRVVDAAVGARSPVTHVLSGTIHRDGTGLRMFLRLVQTKNQRLVWADSVVDFYAFSGNSTIAADRIMSQVTRFRQRRNDFSSTDPIRAIGCPTGNPAVHSTR
jgi:DNA-binding winged helix-turn-helix (wHTH) protein/TolB-like protein